MTEPTNVLDLLLNASVELPTKKVKMKRLSKALGSEFSITLQALSYNQVVEYIRDKDDSELRILLEGIVDPDLKDSRLLSKYNAATPLELLKNPRFLLPGEVTGLSREIEELSGYRQTTFSEIKKN